MNRLFEVLPLVCWLGVIGVDVWFVRRMRKEVLRERAALAMEMRVARAEFEAVIRSARLAQQRMRDHSDDADDDGPASLLC